MGAKASGAAASQKAVQPSAFGALRPACPGRVIVAVAARRKGHSARLHESRHRAAGLTRRKGIAPCRELSVARIRKHHYEDMILPLPGIHAGVTHSHVSHICIERQGSHVI